MRQYIALVMDIQKSRTYMREERNEIQHYILSCIDGLNELFDREIVFSVTFSAGDELQGMFKDVSSAVMYFRLFEMLIAPVKIRAGIGVGEWTIQVEDGISTQQDGPLYHRARFAIETVYSNPLHNICICADTDCTMENYLLNASYSYKTQQLYKQNIVLVLLELIYPFVRHKRMINRYEVIQYLLSVKLEYNIGRRKVDKGMVQKEHINEWSYINTIPREEYILIDGKLKEIENSIIKKNTATIVADIIGGTRQNIDTIIRRGNSNKIRELDYLALQYIEKKYGGDTWNY